MGLRANATADLRELKKPFPLIVRFSLRYFFDSTAKLIRNLEQARWLTLSNRAPLDTEFRHLIVPSERFAYRINSISLSMSSGSGPKRTRRVF